LTLLRFQKWDELLQLPEPQANRKIGNGFWHYGRALAFAAKGERQKALAEKAALEGSRQNTPSDAMWMLNTGQAMLGLASLVLDARLAENPKDAIEAWKRAVKAQDALAYDEPPPWYYPIRESLGAELLRAGNAPEAEAVFRECLRQNPRDPRALFGLMETLKAQKKMDAAQWVQHEFEASWKGPKISLHLEDL
jgi:tetratricopeptide (TPR) repeat protein